MARKLQHKSAQIRLLEQQARAHKINLDRAMGKIQSLVDQLSQACSEREEIDPITTPADSIFHDILQNRARSMAGRRYSRATMLWARQIYDVSPTAWDLVRKVFPLPSDRVLRTSFSEVRSAVSDALLDIDKIDSIMELWRRANPELATDSSVILAVDAVAFRPVVTISEDGTIDGLNHIDEIDADLFDKLVGQPQAFVTFLKEHWTDVYSALFVFQIQPTDPQFHCGIIHILRSTNGKGTSETVSRLFDLKQLLQTHFHLNVCGVAFDGDSCFNRIHQDFSQTWIRSINDRLEFFPSLPFRPVVICDPLHLMKRIRYRWVARQLSIGFGSEQLFFSMTRIKEAGFLSPIVFLDSHLSKMHDSLPLQLFSPFTLSMIFQDHSGPEYVMAPWCLLSAALTILDISTRTRVELLETGFWFLYFHWRLKVRLGHPKGVVEKMTEGRNASLYRSEQLRDALNTFVALIVILRSSSHPICLNRIGSNPLEHAFGKARTRCRDVNTMVKMLAAFTTDILSHSVEVCLDLATVPHRRSSFGTDCAPMSRIESSIFERTPKQIAISLFKQTGISLERLDRELVSDSAWRSEPWKELYKIPEFCPTPPTMPSHHLDFARTIHRKSLSSNTVFMGIIASPRAEHLLTVRGSMGETLETELQQIECALSSMFHRRLSARELELRVHAIAAHLNEDRPSERTRVHFLHWLHSHWSEAEKFMLREYLGHTQWVTGDDSTH
jgi:hypothetical protein